MREIVTQVGRTVSFLRRGWTLTARADGSATLNPPPKSSAPPEEVTEPAVTRMVGDGYLVRTPEGTLLLPEQV